MKFSLRVKTVILIILFALLLSSVATLVSSQAIRQIVDTSYRSRATDIANTLAVTLDVEKVARLKNEIMKIFQATEEKVTSDDWGSPAFDAYTARFLHLEETEDFQSIRQQIRRIQDVNDVDCMYISMVDIPTEYFIYLVDGAYEDPCPPGCLDPLYPENRDLLVDPSIGFPPYITDTEQYGWLVTAGIPVYDGEGTPVCYAMVDISMDIIRGQQTRFILVHSGVLAVLTLIVSILSIWAINRSVIRPINLLSSAAAHYNARTDENSELDNLPIISKDEIQSLYSSIRQMTQDIQGYIDSLKFTTQELKQTQIIASEMDKLAHKDALTGVGSKLAYDQKAKELTEEMRQGTARFGIVMVDMNDLKKMNDTYGHEHGNDAIRKTCSLICETFVHSPVYRFGGDEFVVVVKDRDYDHIEERVNEFNEALRQTGGEPWETVNAAIGYALYDGEDTVEDVFRKADHIMYEHKKEIKARQA